MTSSETCAAPSPHDEAIATRLRMELEFLLRLRPVASHPTGLHAVRQLLAERLAQLGFTVREISRDGSLPVLVAHRPGRGPYTVGLSAHYDVEEEGAGWTVPAFAVTRSADRLYGRGTADNLGPLLLRLQVLEELGDRLPSLVLVLQGEEEVGSPAAHAIYPALDLPRVDLWLEETGYFERDGRQRMLLRRENWMIRPWVEAARRAASDHGREVDVHDRYLNKAFGEHRCPFLTHLVGDAPYLAIGPNDPLSVIHRPDESLAVANLAVSRDQLAAVLRAASEAA